MSIITFNSIYSRCSLSFNVSLVSLLYNELYNVTSDHIYRYPLGDFSHVSRDKYKALQ